MATYLRTDGWVKGTLGPAIAGAQIYVLSQPTANTTSIPPSPLATIYSDVNGLNPITQPISSDGFGHFFFYISSINYTYLVVTGGKIQQVYPDQAPMSLSGGGGGSAITLQTNGVTNATQTLQNLIAGSGISLIADLLGNVTIINTAGGGGGSSVTLQTNSVSNPVQSLLNLKPGINTTVVSDAFGGVTFDLDAVINLTTGIQIAGSAHSGNVLRGNGTNFVSAQLGYTDLSGTPQLAVTKAAVTSNFLTSYTSGTGVFTAAQPAFSDISGTASTGQVPARTVELLFVIDGQGVAPAAGAYASLQIPTAMTITSITIAADQTGSAVLTLKNCSNASYPGSLTSIVASAPPTLSSSALHTDSTLTGWTTSLAANSQLQVGVTSASTLTKIFLNVVGSAAYA